MERTTVYPFTVCYSCYATWRKYAQGLLAQLRACPTCRGAADGFPISFLQKAQKLSDGKMLISKGLNPTIDHVPYTNHTVVEKYDMASIDPNCPNHGKFSRTAWLRKLNTDTAGSVSRPGVKVESRLQIALKARERLKIADKTDGVERPDGESMDTSQLFQLDIEMIDNPLRMVCVHKKHKGENFEPGRQTQIAKPVEKVATSDVKCMSSVLAKKQLRISRVYNQTMGLLSCRTKSPVTQASNCSQEESYVWELESCESNTEQENLNRKWEELAFTGGLDDAQINASRSMGFDDVGSRNISFSADHCTPTQAATATSTISRMGKSTPASIQDGTALMQEFQKVGPKQETSKKNIHGCPETYGSQFRVTCLLKGLNKISTDTCNENVKTMEYQEKKLIERVLELETKLKNKISSGSEYFHQENVNARDEITRCAADELGIPPAIKCSKVDDQPATCKKFYLELEKTAERLEKFACTARALQLGLEDQLVYERPAAAKVRLIKAQGVGKKEARDWLLDTAIERAVNSMPQKTDVGRVRHLVQAFESIK